MELRGTVLSSQEPRRFVSAMARSDLWVLSTVKRQTRETRATMAQRMSPQAPKSLARLPVPVVLVVPVGHGLGLQWTQPFLKKKQSGMHSLKCKRLKKQLNEFQNGFQMLSVDTNIRNI